MTHLRINLKTISVNLGPGSVTTMLSSKTITSRVVKPSCTWYKIKSTWFTKLEQKDVKPTNDLMKIDYITITILVIKNNVSQC